MNSDFQAFLRRNVLVYGKKVTLEIPAVPRGTLPPDQKLTLHFGSKEARRAYVRVSRAQQRAWDFAREFLRKTKPNPKLTEAKKFPNVVDAPKVVLDAYSRLRNQEIQAWNAFAKLGGLPLLPTLRRRGKRRRLLIDYGPEPVQRLMSVVPSAGPIGRSRKEQVYDVEIVLDWPPGPKPGMPPVYGGVR